MDFVADGIENYDSSAMVFLMMMVIDDIKVRDLMMILDQ